ncbi:SDR family NAD(P)-dependent oxidoreductase [Pseudonocardia sp. GCM10023141]|uniref:SDR family NAD(P)-dependent oxidoreductase n=1 Tax=Pseudonocardia sp. GCM10023141 TaxID=3252653 RepID=UPI00360DF11B
MGYPLTGFDGKVAVVTGAGRMRSIGRTVAVRLAEAGCDVVVTGTGRSPHTYPEDERAAGWRDVESVADEIRDSGRRALALVSDAADDAAVAGLADRVVDEFGRVDILVNNAGAARGADRCAVVDLDAAVWRTVIDVNLTGTFLASQVFGRLMVGRGGGCIVNISSIAGKRLSPFAGAYAASKAGIHALTACMAQEVGPAGVRVNAICPGVIDTSRMDAVGRGDAWERTVAGIPLGRAGTGDDVAATVLYLCSEQGAWVTGQAWNVDGGSVVQH